MKIIESPVKGYTGISAGVGFALGRALVKELTPTQEAYFRKKGYKIHEDNEKVENSTTEQTNAGIVNTNTDSNENDSFEKMLEDIE